MLFSCVTALPLPVLIHFLGKISSMDIGTENNFESVALQKQEYNIEAPDFQCRATVLCKERQ